MFPPWLQIRKNTTITSNQGWADSPQPRISPSLGIETKSMSPDSYWTSLTRGYKNRRATLLNLGSPGVEPAVKWWNRASTWTCTVRNWGRITILSWSTRGIAMGLRIRSWILRQPKYSRACSRSSWEELCRLRRIFLSEQKADLKTKKEDPPKDSPSVNLPNQVGLNLVPVILAYPIFWAKPMNQTWKKTSIMILT